MRANHKRSSMQRSRNTLFGLALAVLLAFVPTLTFLQASFSRRNLAAGLLTAVGLEVGAPEPASAELEKLRVAYPPLDRKKVGRCKWISSKMGQANAARASEYDLRECKLAGTDASDKDIAGALMNDGDFSGVNFENAVMSKAVAVNASFENANFKNAVADRVTFNKANLKGAVFSNAVLTTSTFTDCNLEGADFTDAYLNSGVIRSLCDNPTMKGTNPKTGADTYESAECFNKKG
mmetsp:Transcript_95543/g.169652  ORF Transcript_95543/g.169652 Transcript_95543/m.169652 type:complete len:236 (+) Transcript_95543:85-792(+)|eukprot:CAMPEP_0197625802 /NCGR_PEP_ID=MMETSP1338-20131121/5061_1 /TAXON_ID=43686 ORGANISM="Pelagodinium beii, Strain RCC1491" /NCGR_SAMPLE_ID=MMETSP1338 /ASSEMBLY_ACC=CAM_ASM_000754 /LENGTH=235 /DNA_ID=CAMNT_0043196293 /DNA_START=77 /DNA_END=784 /DNA_ORIENTATION=-